MVKKRCRVCGSKRWHEDEDGNMMCSEGHLQADYVNEESAVYDPTFSTSRIRKQVQGPQMAASESESEWSHSGISSTEGGLSGTVDIRSTFWHHGDRAIYLKWQCAQLILRKQIDQLVHEHGFPAHLEEVCRDIWTCVVRSENVVAAPMNYLEGMEPIGTYTGVNKAPTERKKRKRLSASDRVMRAFREAQEQDNISDESDDHEEPRPNPKQLAPSLFKSRPGSMPYGWRKKYAATKNKPRGVGLGKSLPQTTLAVLYLGCVELKLGVTLADLVHLADTFRLEYLNAFRNLPEDMALHANPRIKQTLSPRVVPTIERINISASRNSRSTERLSQIVAYVSHVTRNDVGFCFSPNYHVYIWRLCRLVLGPPELFFAIDRMIRKLPRHFFELAHTPYDGPRDKDAQPAYGELPETLVASCFVLVVKMVYSVGDRGVHSPGPLVDGFPSFDRWIQAAESHVHLENPRDPARLWARHVSAMTEDEIDEYIDYFHENVLPKSSVLYAEGQREWTQRQNLHQRAFGKDSTGDPSAARADGPASESRRQTYASESRRLLNDLYEQMPAPCAPRGEFIYTPLRQQATLAQHGALARILALAAAYCGLADLDILHYAESVENALSREFQTPQHSSAVHHGGLRDMYAQKIDEFRQGLEPKIAKVRKAHYREYQNAYQKSHYKNWPSRRKKSVVGGQVESVGERVGENVGERVGENVGERVGENVGERVGENVGERVGGSPLENVGGSP